MSRAIKISVVILCLPLLVLGLGAMFNPMAMLERFAVEPDGIHGLNTLRADIGGLLLGTAVLMLLGVFRNEKTWFLAAAVMMGVVAFGRLVGLAFDGFDPSVVPPLVVELVIVGAVIFAHRRLP
jgi:hypothetical protein